MTYFKGKSVFNEKTFTPISSDCEAVYAVHRIKGYSGNIMRVRRVVAGDEVNIYDFARNTSLYKLTSDGAWIDGSTETFFVVTWYDQSGNSRDATQATAGNQLTLTLNNKNGYPTLGRQSDSNVLRCVDATTSGTMIAGADYDQATFVSFDGLLNRNLAGAGNLALTGNTGTSTWYAQPGTLRYENDTVVSSNTITTLNQWNIFTHVFQIPVLDNNGLVICQDRVAVIREWNGDINFAYINSTVLSQADRLEVIDYFNRYYQIF